MDRNEKIGCIRETGIIAIMRARSSEQLIAAGQAIRQGGIRVIEVTMTTPGALEVIAQASESYGEEVLFGAGTVLDVSSAHAAIRAGAGFIVSPTLDVDVIALCNQYSVPVIPGCFSPTEILTAWRAGAPMVKLFPASLGGPDLVKAIRAPLPQVQIVPVGGVSIDNTAAFVRSGAVAVGVSSNLVSQSLLDAGDMAELTRRAAAFVAEVQKGRGKPTSPAH